MICPWCKSDNLMCKDSRPTKLGRRRRYLCGNCGRRFSTLELPVWPPEPQPSAEAPEARSRKARRL